MRKTQFISESLLSSLPECNVLSHIVNCSILVEREYLPRPVECGLFLVLILTVERGRGSFPGPRDVWGGALSLKNTEKGVPDGY